LADFEWQPSYEFRHNTAKLFFELGENSLATNIWETLLEENDQIAEVHYFLANSYRKISTQAARECANQAKQVSQTSPNFSFLFDKLDVDDVIDTYLLS